MAKTKAYKTAERKRNANKAARDKAMEKARDKSKPASYRAKAKANAMKAASRMRAAGDDMREITGREKGERTTYTGPAKQSTIDLIRSTTGDVLPEETKWQKVNAAWQNELMKNENLTRAQARTKLKTLFSKDRERYLKEQQQRYDDNIVADVVEKTKDSKVKSGGGGSLTRATGVGATGLGGLMMETDPYRRSAPLDWSDIMPQDTPLQSQQEIISGGGKYYQPWATRQDTPLSLINYDKPRGNIPAVSFIPPGTQVTADYSGDTSGTTDDNGGVVTAPGEPAGWVGPRDPRTGLPFASFMDYTKYMHAKNQGLLPDSTLASTSSADTLLGSNTTNGSSGLIPDFYNTSALVRPDISAQTNRPMISSGTYAITPDARNATPSAANTNLLTYSNPASVAGKFPVAPVNVPAATVNTAIPRYLTEPGTFDIYPYNPYQSSGMGPGDWMGL